MRKDKKKQKTSKKIVAAFAMFALSASMLGTATYAWFTMNKEVTVTGMMMKTKVGSNLLVTGDNVEASYTNDLVQSRAALLEPVSTVSGVDESFYYTVNAKANGDANVDEYVRYNESTALTGNHADKINTSTWQFNSTGAAKDKYDATFNGNTAYNISGHSATPDAAYKNAYGYVDYTFYLKATSDANNQEICLTECNLIANNAVINNSATGSGAKTDNDLAWRVAIFAEEISNEGNGVTSDEVTGASDTAKIILTRDGSENQTAGKAVESESSANGNVAYNTWADGKKYIGKIAAAGTTKYYKVVARVWLEGEDKSCKSSTYALLTSNDYEFGMQFELLESGSGDSSSVTNIGSSISDDTGLIMKSGS